MPKLRLRSCFWMRMRPNGDILATKEAVMRDNAADEIQRRAVEWHIRLRDGDDDLWDSFSLRSEEHTSELQSLMRISYAVFCLKKKKKNIIMKLSKIANT